MHRIFSRRLLGAVFLTFLAVPGLLFAHVVPNMTVEAEFTSAGGYTLRINVDPRTFLAAEPTSLPPVPASWYLEQTPEQVAATHEKAQQYLASALGLLFDGKKTVLPACKIRAMDGADNTPLKADTQEVHLLATASGQPMAWTQWTRFIAQWPSPLPPMGGSTWLPGSTHWPICQASAYSGTMVSGLV